MRFEYLNEQAKNYTAFHELECDCLPAIQNRSTRVGAQELQFLLNDKPARTSSDAR
jgi:hypothetical protein